MQTQKNQFKEPAHQEEKYRRPKEWVCHRLDSNELKVHRGEASFPSSQAVKNRESERQKDLSKRGEISKLFHTTGACV